MADVKPSFIFYSKNESNLLFKSLHWNLQLKSNIQYYEYLKYGLDRQKEKPQQLL
ncbi:hypothetical protein [Bacillus sp. FSL K6-1218]|uniref:hypothetical protein n=1 Tax=Bacillus sp. FSL K6-1218 TaxID=2921467 RepID=UPI000AE53DA7